MLTDGHLVCATCHNAMCQEKAHDNFWLSPNLRVLLQTVDFLDAQYNTVMKKGAICVFRLVKNLVSLQDALKSPNLSM